MFVCVLLIQFLLLKYIPLLNSLCASELIYYAFKLNFFFTEFLTMFFSSLSFCLYFILFVDDKRGSRCIVFIGSELH